MRLAALAFAGALGIAALPVTARAVPMTSDAAQLQGQSPAIVQVWGGCGRGWHPVPGHWSRWRGGWVPPHCAPNGGGYGPAYGPGWRPYRGW